MLTSEPDFGDTAHPFEEPAGSPPRKKRRANRNDELPAATTQPSKKPRNEHNNGLLVHTDFDHTSASGKSAYPLNRDYAATTRLNCQYLLWKMELGWSLHPEICLKKYYTQPTINTSAEEPASTAAELSQVKSPIAAESEVLRIADLATGTAIWALDVARNFPLVQIDGFDIDLQQSPPPSWLPDNVTLQEWDILSSMSSELENRYDVVHIRLLLLVIQMNNPRPVLKNALRMLKKGGSLQWDELDPWGAHTVQTSKQDENISGSDFQKRQELTAMSSLKWVTELHSIMEEVGFEDVKREEIACDLRLAKFYQDMQFLVMEEQAEHEPTAEGKHMVKEAIVQGALESRNGKARVTPKIVCLGTKPGGFKSGRTD